MDIVIIPRSYSNPSFRHCTMVIRYMRSASEVKRIQLEKKLKKDFETAEERRRLEFLKAERESHDKHRAATLISLLYRNAKAKKMLKYVKLLENDVFLYWEKSVFIIACYM